MTEGRNGCESVCACTGETGGTGPPGPPGSPAVALSGMDLEYSSSGLGSAAGQYILILFLVSRFHLFQLFSFKIKCLWGFQ